MMNQLPPTANVRRRTVLGGMALGTAAVLTPALTVSAHGDEPVASGFAVQPTLSHLGQVELSWPETDHTSARWYTVHRSSGAVPQLNDDTKVATIGVYASGELGSVSTRRPPAYGDFSTVADTSYVYVVAVRAADMTVLAASDPVSISTAERIDDQQLPLVAYAYRTTAGDTVIQWRRAPSSVGTLEIAGGPAPHRNPSWNVLANTTEQSGTLTLRSGQSRRIKHLLLSADGETTRLPVLEQHRPPLLLSASLIERLRTQTSKAEETVAITLQRLLEDLDKPHTAWAYGAPLGPQRVTATKASHAALAWQLTQDPAYAQRAYDEFVVAAGEIYFGGADQPLFLGAISTRLALTYDWARNAWDEQQQHVARQLLNRIAAIWTATHFINDFRHTKASNWVGITRSGELLVRLALLGTSEYVDDIHRTTLVIDEINRHLQDGYGSSGYTQEGLAYFIYPMRELVPAALALRSLSLPFLEPELARHEWTNLGAHTQSMIPGGHRTQFGVDSGLSSSHQYAGEFASQTMALATPSLVPAAQWHYDHVTGTASTTQDYGTELGRELTILTYPDSDPVNPESVPSLQEAMLDDEKGAFFFRNRHEDADDVLVGVFNRNTVEAGWEAMETFGLPILGLAARWTVMGEKPGNPWRMSKPLKDGQPEPSTGEGITVASHRLPGQGGGYVELDASGNYEVLTAQRSMLVDMTERDDVHTVIALHDTFEDDNSHEWTWQLPIGPGVQPTMLQDEGGLRTFVYRRQGAWMKGWFIPEPNQQVWINPNQTRRMQAITTDRVASFRLVLALGRGAEIAAARSGHTITVAGASYDLDNLSAWR